MVLISGEIITWRRNNDLHFSPKGKNGAQNAICPSGVKITIMSAQKSSDDAIITLYILAQKGKMAFKTPFVPRELTYIIMLFVIIVYVTRKNSFFLGEKFARNHYTLFMLVRVWCFFNFLCVEVTYTPELKKFEK